MNEEQGGLQMCLFVWVAGYVLTPAASNSLIFQVSCYVMLCAWVCHSWCAGPQYHQNIGHHVPNGTVSHPRGLESSVVSVWESQIQGCTQEKGCQAGAPPPPNPQKWNLKKHRFCRFYDIKSFKCFPLQLKSATEFGWWLVHYNFEKEWIKFKKTQDLDTVIESWNMLLYLFVSAVADSVMLCLQHDFYDIIFKIKHNFYVASGSVPPPQWKILGAHLLTSHI
jgi:hypothetical protein